MKKTSRELVLIAHNIRSAYNVGSLLRTADSLGVARVILTGYSPSSSHVRVKKTALGAESSVKLEEAIDVVDVLAALRRDGYRIVGLELDLRSISLRVYEPPEKIALLLGNECEGITLHLRDACDDLVMIEQHGMKESMNVSVAAGIATYSLLTPAS